jgi:hypothetical protein
MLPFGGAESQKGMLVNIMQPIVLGVLSVIASAGALATSQHAARPLTMAEIASAPFPYDLTA